MTALALLAFAAYGCKRRSAELSTGAYIMGPTNDIVPVGGDTEKQIAPNALNGSVLLATHLHDKRVKFCSGTLIAPGRDGESYRVLANHHCFAQTDADDKATPELLPEACTATKAYFGFVAGRTEASTELGCQPGTLRTNFEGDLAVFTLTGNPPEPYRPVALWDGEDPPTDRAALIVHYPDVETQMAEPPDGGAKLPVAQATLKDCKVVGGFPVSEWDLDRTLPFSLRHTCDLIHGSSGSGLIDAETGKLLGVNWGGIKISYEDVTRTDNVATRASFVQAFLENRAAEAVRLADDTRAHQALAATRKNDADIKKTGGNLAEGIKKKTCGTLGSDAADDGNGAARALALVLAMLLPPLAAVRVGSAVARSAKADRK